jgi:hypothetical protein
LGERFSERIDGEYIERFERFGESQGKGSGEKLRGLVRVRLIGLVRY